MLVIRVAADLAAFGIRQSQKTMDLGPETMTTFT